MSLREEHKVTMETIVALTKRRGFDFPSDEIYGRFDVVRADDRADDRDPLGPRRDHRGEVVPGDAADADDRQVDRGFDRRD